MKNHYKGYNFIVAGSTEVHRTYFGHTVRKLETCYQVYDPYGHRLGKGAYDAITLNGKEGVKDRINQHIDSIKFEGGNI